jgi:hypothetical protein
MTPVHETKPDWPSRPWALEDEPIVSLGEIEAIDEDYMNLVCLLADDRKLRVPKPQIARLSPAWKTGDRGELLVTQRWATAVGARRSPDRVVVEPPIAADLQPDFFRDGKSK